MAFARPTLLLFLTVATTVIADNAPKPNNHYTHHPYMQYMYHHPMTYGHPEPKGHHEMSYDMHHPQPHKPYSSPYSGYGHQVYQPYVHPQPAYPHQMYAHPQPAHHHPEPAYRHPEPAYRHPEPAYHRPEPAYHRPEPAYHHPEPAYEPKMMYHQPYTAYQPVQQYAYQGYAPAQPAHAAHQQPHADDMGMMHEDVMVKEEEPTAVATDTPRYLGTFANTKNLVEGDIFLLDERTLYIQGFSFDGKAPDVYFWSDGTRIPYYTRSDTAVKMNVGEYHKEDIVLMLPSEKPTIKDLHHFQVWCRQFGINFGEFSMDNAHV